MLDMDSVRVQSRLPAERPTLALISVEGSKLEPTYWSSVMISRWRVYVRAKRNAKSLASDPELTK